jgi:hypothetical protein
VKTRFEQRRHPSLPGIRNINTSVTRRRGGFPPRSGVLDGHSFESSFGVRGNCFASARLDQTREEWFGLPLRADQWFGSFETFGTFER